MSSEHEGDEKYQAIKTKINIVNVKCDSQIYMDFQFRPF